MSSGRSLKSDEFTDRRLKKSQKVRKCYHLECHGFLDGWGEGSVSKCDSNIFGAKYVDASAAICFALTVTFYTCLLAVRL